MQADEAFTPDGRWVLHSTDVLGNLTAQWIETQANTHQVFQTRLLGLTVAPGATRSKHWIVASDRPLLYLSYRGMYKSGGLSTIALARFFRTNPPSIVHAHYGMAASQQRMLARALGAPLVVSFYGFEATKHRYTRNWLWKRRYLRLFRDAATVFAEGPAMAMRIEALGCPGDKLRVVRLPANAPGLSGIVRRVPDQFVVVAPGWATEKKGFDLALEAFSRALKGEDARLVFLGGGTVLDALKRRAAELNVEGQVAYLGALPFSDFMNNIAGASVAVFPSRTARNGDSDGGAPVTLIESQWLGVPALVSDHDDLPFVSAPGGSVILPPHDVDSWSHGLRDLYDSPGQLESMGAKAAAFVQARHSPTQNLRAREAIYENSAKA